LDHITEVYNKKQESIFNSKEWDVFVEIEELFILVPALLGLKGNLDAMLASRLSTQANLGNMVNVKEIIHIVVGNIGLVQVQAIVAGFIVSFFSITVGYSINGGFVWDHAFLMIASSVATATTSCFVLDFILAGFVLLSIKYKSNPDNMVKVITIKIDS
jgi:solute carrier family 41